MQTTRHERQNGCVHTEHPREWCHDCYDDGVTVPVTEDRLRCYGATDDGQLKIERVRRKEGVSTVITDIQSAHVDPAVLAIMGGPWMDIESDRDRAFAAEVVGA